LLSIPRNGRNARIDTASVLALWPLRQRQLRLLRTFLEFVACVALDGNQALRPTVLSVPNNSRCFRYWPFSVCCV